MYCVACSGVLHYSKFERAFWGLERGFGGEGFYVAFTAFLPILTAEHFLEHFFLSFEF
jgi:hypothetical protein